MPQKAVFFDRDDTLNIDPGYLNDPEKVELFPGVPEGIAKLRNEYNFKIVVVSNQSGITRGIVKESDVLAINSRINKVLSKTNAVIDAFYFCPYHPDFDPPEKVICRKPSPYMIVKASEDLDINLSRSYLVGDKATDIDCGKRAGLKTVLINYSGKDEEINILHKEGKTPNFVAADFTKACEFIITDFLGDNN